MFQFIWKIFQSTQYVSVYVTQAFKVVPEFAGLMIPRKSKLGTAYQVQRKIDKGSINYAV